MQKIIVGGLGGRMALAQNLRTGGRKGALYLGATVDLCRQMRTELVRLDFGNTYFVTFQDLARRLAASRRIISPLEQEALFNRLAQTGYPQIQAMAQFPGFWQEVARAASELAYSGALPENLSVFARGLSGLQQEVCQLLVLYWQYLEEHKLSDSVLVLRTALGVLEKKEWSCLVVDGFSDFTALQEEILAKLVQRSENTIINLMGATPTEARQLGQRLGGGFQLEELPQENADFIRAANVQVLATISLKQEVEEACRWLKEQIRLGCAPHELVLIARHPKLYRNLISQTLAKMEIPSEVTASVEDQELPPVFAARCALSLAREDWPQASFIRLVQLLLGVEQAFVVDRLSREAKLLEGKDRWQELIEKSLGQETALAALCQELSELSRPQPVEEYCQRLWQLVKSRLTITAPGAPAIRQLLALGRLESILQELAALSPYFPQPLELEEFERLFLKAASGSVNQPEDRCPYRGTGVRLLDPVGARGLTWRGAAVLGLEEGQYPTPWPEDWLFPEKVRHDFHKAGIMLQSREAMAGRERDFFQLALSRAQERLLLSYKTIDDGGSPILPSPYLVELLGKHDYPNRQLSLSQQFPEDSSKIATAGELALFAFSTGNSQLWAEYTKREPQLAKSISRAGAVIEKRNSRLWSPFDGKLTYPQVQTALPFSSNYIWSAGQLETYGSCPFRFFCQEVLKIKPYPQLDVELTPLDLGTVLHNVLAQFFLVHKGESLFMRRREAYRRELFELLEKNWQGIVEDVFEELQKEDALRRLYRFLDWELEKQKSGDWNMLPRFTEASFGMEQEPVEVQLSDRKIQLRGRIDRVDLSPDGDFMVLDYKLSYIPTYKELASSLSFQLPVYLWAGQKLLGPEARPIAALFYSLGQGKFCGFWRDEETQKVGLKGSKKSRLDEVMWTETMEHYRQLLSGILERIGQGDFRLLPEKCPPYCDYTTICRYQKWRIRRKETAGNA